MQIEQLKPLDAGFAELGFRRMPTVTAPVEHG